MRGATNCRWAAVLLVFVAMAPLASPAVEAFRVFSEPVRASTLIGIEVRSPLGQPAGTVRDLMLDLRNNRVHYVVLERGNVRSKHPMHAFTLPRNDSHLVLDRPEARIATAWDNVILMPAGELIGRAFAFAQGAGDGRVADVVLDAFWGDVAFAAVRIDEVAPALRPLPLDAFETRGQALSISVRRQALASLPGFSLDELAEGLDDRDFLQRTTRGAHRLTPIASAGGASPPR
jgi:sporulation protein YlmC with PRC-barrel domain